MQKPFVQALFVQPQRAGRAYAGFALFTNAHMEKYGTTRENLSQVSVKNHSFGEQNPKAKAWQGLVVGPAIAIYLLIRYYEYFIPKQNLYSFKRNIRQIINNFSNEAKVANTGS